eukprot:1300751-Rhodomonas_salina.1
MSGTDLAIGTICIRAYYAISVLLQQSVLAAHTPAMPCPVLTSRTVLSANNACAITLLCHVRTHSDGYYLPTRVLRGCYAMSGTDRAIAQVLGDIIDRKEAQVRRSLIAGPAWGLMSGGARGEGGARVHGEVPPVRPRSSIRSCSTAQRIAPYASSVPHSA